jgi:molybdopterin-guanine dinucleotide biosynthesis protein A
MTDRVPAIVLAGGKTSPELAAEGGVPPTRGSRSLAEINGIPMIRYVLSALEHAETISRVILSAPAGFPTQAGVDLQLAGDGELSDNLAAAAAECADDEHVLIVSADIPYATGAGIDDYVRRCLREGIDCCYSAVSREACEKRFPGMRRTYIHTPKGSFTGGNVVFQRVETLDRQLETLRRAYQSRKNPLFLARLIGPGNVLKYALRTLTLEDIGRAASRVMGVRCRLIVTSYAELGTDIDRAEDLRLARAYPPSTGTADSVEPGSTRKGPV